MAKRRVGRIKRRSAVKEPKVRFTLFCEGRNTEPAYFSAMERKWTDVLVKIMNHRGFGDPFTIAKEAKKFAKESGLRPNGKRRRNFFEQRDQVWAVFDRDEHEKFEDSVRLCETNGIKVARSNPCFEVWLILHEGEFDRPDDRRRVQKALHILRPEYEQDRSKVPDCEEMVDRVKDAEARAEVLLQRRKHEGDPYGRPSTTVGRLTKAIRETDVLTRRSTI